MMTPVSRAERLALVDVLRGAALFGIITANMRGFAGPLAGYIDHTLMWTDPPDRAAQAAVDFFVTGKFITLFAFMFGIGFAIQMDRASARGVTSCAFYVRRLGLLAVFGLAHSMLLWWGDILMPYAVMGFALLLFRKRSQTSVLRWAAVFYAYPVVVMTLMLVLHAAGVPLPIPPPTTPEELQRVLAAYGAGSYGAIVRENLGALAFNLLGLVFFYPRVLGIFLFGLWVWRQGIIQNLASNAELMRQCQRHGLWVGLVFNGATVAVMEVFQPNPMVPSAWGLVANVTGSVGMPAGSLFYASTLALLWQNPEWRARLEPFGAVGRTALTNYLLQTVVCTTLFYSWGGGLFGTVGPLLALVPTLTIYAAQVALSVWWTRRFAYGPMEWVWRCLTYGRAALAAGLQPATRVAQP
jgi:uncharacterized protein